ncbi:Sestrin-1 [Coemansia sp. IMI 209128]|nr:Sestrin-1 [Coemansia sp. IMI 209128]
MSGQHSFPRMPTSPNGSPIHSSHRSPGHSARNPARTESANPRSCWATMRRERQARVDAVLDAHATNVAAGLPSPPQRSENTRGAAAQDIVKAVRSRAREVGWMLGKRTKPRATRLTSLAQALRSTQYDEDDVISDGLRAGGLAEGPAEQSAEFDTVQEIVALRGLMRSLVRLQTEHPDADVRRSTGELLVRLHGGEKKTLNIPLPRATAAGPSFFFPAQAFAQVVHAHASNTYDAGDLSSSDEEFSACSDDSSQPERVDNWARNFAEVLETPYPLGPPHLFQLLQAQPQCGYALAMTFGSIFNVQRSSVKESDAHCLFAAAAAQVGCFPLVCLAEGRALATCDNENGAACEAWLNHGLQAAPAKSQLLARFGARLCARPWHLCADDVARYIDEYVHIHATQSTSAMSTPRRSLSSSVIAAGLSRKSVEESALRDLLHAVVIMSVGHGLGTFASACGITPDLDLPAGSFFPPSEPFMVAETVSGLSPVPPPELPQPPLQEVPMPLSPTFVGQVEKNTADMIARLQQPLYPEPARSDNSYHVESQMSPHMPWIQQHSLPPPPVSLLRHLSGGAESRTSAYLRSLGHVIDPLTSTAQHFDAYRHMRARKLAKYDLPNEAAAPQLPADSGNGIDCEPPMPQPSIERPRALQSQGQTTSVHLTTREDLHWDSLSAYLRQQLSINDDYLGKEAQTARGLTARPFAEAAMPCVSPQSDSSDTAVFVADLGISPLKSEGSKHEWDRSPEFAEGGPIDDLRPKCYSMSNVFSVSHTSPSRNIYPSTKPASSSSRTTAPLVVDARQFHDAIWHYTLSLYHIYEEYYFYSKFKDEMTPDSTQIDLQRPARYADTNYYSQQGAVPIPSQHNNHSYYKGSGPEAMSVDTEMDMDMSNSSSQCHFSNSPQQYNKRLTEELKLHIRSVVRNPGSIHAVAAQPPMATGLNLCIEEMVHVNLVISLAQRQAEIIHGIRAIREYEEGPARR